MERDEWTVSKEERRGEGQYSLHAAHENTRLTRYTTTVNKRDGEIHCTVGMRGTSTARDDGGR